MRRIVLLGANGQLGSDIRTVFAEAGDFHLIPVLRDDLDVSELHRIDPFLSGLGDFDYVINCTSYHKTDECEDYPEKAFRINSLAPWEMAKYCSRHGKALVHFTTDYVFGNSRSVPIKEEDATEPLNTYGISKAAGEHYIKSCLDRHFIIRTSSLYGTAGSSGKGGNFVETMIGLGRRGIPLKVVDDQIMSPTHTLDIARAIAAIVAQDCPEFGVYHISGEGQCSWYGFAKEIFSQIKLEADLTPVSSAEYATKARRPAYSVLDNGKINSIYRMPRWEQALSEYLSRKGYSLT